MGKMVVGAIRPEDLAIPPGGLVDVRGHALQGRLLRRGIDAHTTSDDGFYAVARLDEGTAVLLIHVQSWTVRDRGWRRKTPPSLISGISYMIVHPAKDGNVVSYSDAVDLDPDSDTLDQLRHGPLRWGPDSYALTWLVGDEARDVYHKYFD
jgi:hypothetical protein